MLKSMSLLLGFQLAGEFLSHAFSLPLPGPVLGMVMLFITLMFVDGLMEQVEVAATPLLSHLPLLYVPAVVGVLVHVEIIKASWMTLLITVIGSTAITLVVTAGSMKISMRYLSKS